MFVKGLSPCLEGLEGTITGASVALGFVSGLYRVYQVGLHEVNCSILLMINIYPYKVINPIFIHHFQTSLLHLRQSCPIPVGPDL